MTDRTAFRKFGKTADKWRELAEKRRDYFRDLYRSGRWRLYYNEEEFIARLRDVARTCDRWGVIVETSQALTDTPLPQSDTIEQREAA